MERLYITQRRILKYSMMLHHTQSGLSRSKNINRAIFFINPRRQNRTQFKKRTSASHLDDEWKYAISE